MKAQEILCCNGGRVRVSVNQDETVITTIDDENARSVVSLSPSDVWALVAILQTAASYGSGVLAEGGAK